MIGGEEGSREVLDGEGRVWSLILSFEVSGFLINHVFLNCILKLVMILYDESIYSWNCIGNRICDNYVWFVNECMVWCMVFGFMPGCLWKMNFKKGYLQGLSPCRVCFILVSVDVRETQTATGTTTRIFWTRVVQADVMNQSVQAW